MSESSSESSGAVGARDHTNRRRAESFGDDAAQYDAVRPGYPEAMLDELLALAADGLDSSERPLEVLDVGIGTGKLGLPIRRRGHQVLGVEPDDRMAQVAREHGLSVEVATLEGWDPAGRSFDLIVAGQAWHWVHPQDGPRIAAQLLRPGGMLAAVWNLYEPDASIRAELDEIYRRVAPALAGRSVVLSASSSRIGDQLQALRDSGRFAAVEERRYGWASEHTAQQWLTLIGTHSDHRGLPAQSRAALDAELTALIERHGGVLRVAQETVALIARTDRGIDLITLPEVALRMDLPILAVEQLVKDGELVIFRNREGRRAVPASFVAGGVVVKSLPAVIRLLRDARFSDAEIVDWLHRADPTLPGTPIEALRQNRGTEIKRRAQAAGF